MTLTDEQIAWALEFALGRAPAGAEEIAALRPQAGSLKELGRKLLTSAECQMHVASLIRDTLARPDDFTRRRIVFLHIPKTAGTTVRQALYRNFENSDVFPDTNWIGAYPANMLVKYRLFAGHFTLHDIMHIPDPKQIFTVLREPRQRIISYFRYRQARLTSHPPSASDPLGPVLHLPLKAFLRDPAVRAHRGICNTQARFLYCLRGEGAGLGRRQRFGVDHAFTLDNVLANLASLSGVGLVEQLDAFVAQYFIHMGMKPPGGLGRTNVTDELEATNKARLPPPSLDDETNELLDDLVSLDEPLYQSAQLMAAEQTLERRFPPAAMPLHRVRRGAANVAVLRE